MRTKILSYIKTWERRCYSDGLPDEAPLGINDLVPSYKRIALAILKNDYPLKSLGFTPEVSEYYNVLKRVELGIVSPIKNKRMTQHELKEFVFSLTKILIDKQCYIKGYGDKYRVCDKNHNPLKNITKDVFNTLKTNNIIKKDRLVYTLTESIQPFTSAVDIKLPTKNE